MPRSGEAVRRRLEITALRLYRKHGYDATTAAEIAAEAGVTERTFFRHFTGKREVLLEASPPNGPLAVLRRAFRAVIRSRGRTGHLPVRLRIRPGAARANSPGWHRRTVP